MWVRSGYGPLGHRLWETTPRTDATAGQFGVTLTDYDKLGRPYYAWASANPQSVASITEYYANDKVKKTTDPQGGYTEYTYDPVGNLLQTKTLETTSGAVIQTDYTYGTYTSGGKTCGDPGGLLSKVEVSRNGAGKKIVATYGYDDWSRLASVTTSLGKTVSYRYYRDGSLWQKTDARSNTTQMTYDPAGRLLTREYIRPGQTLAVASLTVRFGYDHDGKLLNVKDPTFAGGFAVEYTYYGSGLVKQETQTNVGRKIDYTYTASGKEETVKVRDLAGALLATYKYEYWPNDAIKTVTDPSGVITLFHYDSRGRLSDKTSSRNENVLAKSVYTYLDSPAPCGYADSRNLTASIKHYKDGTSSPIYTATYTSYDKVGNLKSIAESGLGGSATTAYNYDKLYQLLTETRTGANPFSHTYTYDAWGNRKTADTVTYSYDDDNKLTSTSTGGAYSYDDDGDLTGKTVAGAHTSYTYDIDGNLTSVTLLPSNRVISFAYDSDGTRITRTDGSTTTKYLYAGGGLLQELGAGGAVQRWYNPGISQTSGTLTSFLQPDHLGSTVSMPSTDLTTTGFSYDAWGNTVSQSGSLTTPFGFVGAKGYYTDEGTGLMKLGCRYYDPTIGRFITKDPKRDGLNWYAYCGNNPVNAADPTGLSEYRAWDSCSCPGEYLIENAETFVANTFQFLNDNITINSNPDPDSFDGMCAAFLPLGGVAAGLEEAGGAALSALKASPTVAKLSEPAGKILANNKGAIGKGIKAASDTVAKLTFAHSEATIKGNYASFEYWSKQSTADIFASLKPGLSESLKVYPDGVIANGNTRLRILFERGIDINTLPFEQQFRQKF